MISLPVIGRAAPRTYTSAVDNPVAARCALTLAPKGPIAPVVKSKSPVEMAQLERILREWMERATQGLRIFQPKLHLSLDRAPGCNCEHANEVDLMSAWLINRDGDAWNTTWRLDRRWASLQREAPGMAATALDALVDAGREGLPIYTPAHAKWFCSWAHWYAEDDDKEALANWGDEGVTVEEAEKNGFPSTRWLEKMLPPIAKEHQRLISRKRLEQSWGPRRDVARAIVELRDAIKANAQRRAGPQIHRETDDFCCIGFGATLRWKPDDPMAQLFDDYANSMFESHHVEEHYGWYTIADPEKELRAVLGAIERRFNVARAAEKLIGLVAEEF